MQSTRTACLVAFFAITIASTSVAQIVVSSSVRDQVLADKSSWTRSEQKLSSRLVGAQRQMRIDGTIDKNRQRASLLSGSGLAEPAIPTDASGRAHVYVNVTSSTTAAIRDSVIAVGGAVDDYNDEFGIIQAWVPPTQLSRVASISSVRTIDEIVPPIATTGSVNSAGDSRLRADVARSLFSVDGSGVKVGVMSDDCGSNIGNSSGNTNLANSVTTGNIRAATNAASHILDDGYTIARSHEGLAMMEIVQDVAPEADIYFATAFGGTATFINNIQALADAGCKVITDDVIYFAEPVFEDGPIAQKVDEVANDEDVLYTSSALNSGARTYTGTYNPLAGQTIFSVSGTHNVHNYGGGDFTNTFTFPANSSLTFVLHWDDEYGASANDFDLFFTTSSQMFSSTNLQNGTQNPVESIALTNNGGVGIANCNIIIRRTTVAGVNPNSTPRLHLKVFGNATYQFTTSTGSVYGHTAANECIAAGAIDASAANYNTIESFSSRGPVEMIDFTSTTRPRPVLETRTKPDVSSYDGVAHSVAGFSNPFYGTSASTPHVAGLAALVRQSLPSLDRTDVANLLRNSAVDYGTVGADKDYGYGRTDAFTTLAMGNANGTTRFAGFATPNASIPDNNATGVSSTINIAAPNTAVGTLYLSATIDSHTKLGDLKITLTSPDGTRRVVMNQPASGAADDNNPNVVFSDNASTEIDSYNPGGSSNEVVGLFEPGEHIFAPLAFDGRDLGGDWTLTVADVVAGNSGATLKHWGLYSVAGEMPLALVNYDPRVGGEGVLVSFDSQTDETGVDITFPSVNNPGRFTVALYGSAPTSPTGINQPVVVDYRWVMDAFHGFTFGGNPTVAFNTSQVPGWLYDVNGIGIYHRPDPGTGTFTQLTTSVNGSTISGNVSGFSEFGAGANDLPLPVKLASFSAAQRGRFVDLSWVTASEVDNAGFIVERSTSRDAGFNPIASYLSNPSLAGYGTTSQRHEYFFTDDAELEVGRTYFYRLRQIDLSGTINEPKEVREVLIGSVDAEVVTFALHGNEPNPFSARTVVRFDSDIATSGTLLIFDGLGRLTSMKNVTATIGENLVEVDASSLPPGVYQYRLQIGSRTRSRSMTIVR